MKIVGLVTMASFLAVTPVLAEGQIIEQVKTYPVSGQTGSELYASIGDNGPKAGVSRAIALTTFDLKWSRKYVPKGGVCTLVSARPKLIITYTLPKPSGRLPAGLQARWDTFIDGVSRHEKVHGDMIKEMVRTIEAATIGFSHADDPGCTKIRKAITKPLSEASLAQRQKSRDFDRAELGNGGNVHTLILNLVNGG